MAKVSQVSQEVLATTKSSEGSSDRHPKTRVQELCASRGPEAPQQTQQSASSQRNTIPDPSDIYLAPQFQESFNQVARATMDEINRTTGRTLGRVVPSQRRDHSSNSSERAPRTVASSGTAHGGTFQKSRVVDIRKNLMARHQFTQVATEQLTNLRVLEWLHDLPTDPKETILTIQDVDKDGIKYFSHDNTESNWVAPDGPLRVSQSNLDLLEFGRSTGTSMDIFVRRVGVGLTHTENLIIKKLKSARETG